MSEQIGTPAEELNAEFKIAVQDEEATYNTVISGAIIRVRQAFQRLDEVTHPIPPPTAPSQPLAP